MAYQRIDTLFASEKNVAILADGKSYVSDFEASDTLNPDVQANGRYNRWSSEDSDENIIRNIFSLTSFRVQSQIQKNATIDAKRLASSYEPVFAPSSNAFVGGCQMFGVSYYLTDCVPSSNVYSFHSKSGTDYDRYEYENICVHGEGFVQYDPISSITGNVSSRYAPRFEYRPDKGHPYIIERPLDFDYVHFYMEDGEDYYYTFGDSFTTKYPYNSSYSVHATASDGTDGTIDFDSLRSYYGIGANGSLLYLVFRNDTNGHGSQFGIYRNPFNNTNYDSDGNSVDLSSKMTFKTGETTASYYTYRSSFNGYIPLSDTKMFLTQGNAVYHASIPQSFSADDVSASAPEFYPYVIRNVIKQGNTLNALAITQFHNRYGLVYGRISDSPSSTVWKTCGQSDTTIPMSGISDIDGNAFIVCDAASGTGSGNGILFQNEGDEPVPAMLVTNGAFDTNSYTELSSGHYGLVIDDTDNNVLVVRDMDSSKRYLVSRSFTVEGRTYQRGQYFSIVHFPGTMYSLTSDGVFPVGLTYPVQRPNSVDLPSGTEYFVNAVYRTSLGTYRSDIHMIDISSWLNDYGYPASNVPLVSSYVFNTYQNLGSLTSTDSVSPFITSMVFAPVSATVGSPSTSSDMDSFIVGTRNSFSYRFSANDREYYEAFPSVIAAYSGATSSIDILGYLPNAGVGEFTAGAAYGKIGARGSGYLPCYCGTTNLMTYSVSPRCAQANDSSLFINLNDRFLTIDNLTMMDVSGRVAPVTGSTYDYDAEIIATGCGSNLSSGYIYSDDGKNFIAPSINKTAKTYSPFMSGFHIDKIVRTSYSSKDKYAFLVSNYGIFFSDTLSSPPSITSASSAGSTFTDAIRFGERLFVLRNDGAIGYVPLSSVSDGAGVVPSYLKVAYSISDMSVPISEMTLETSSVPSSSVISRYDNVETVLSFNRFKSQGYHKSNMFSIRVENLNIDDVDTLTYNEKKQLKLWIANRVKNLANSLAPSNTQLFKVSIV
jgi:hypothetical protein